ncbi:MAG TPA: DUF6036 family nucleotidyltransferase [Humisphaera sp.]|jgi:hypothetical protein|nr:DUF6036 family nucleotidyltransferase [Humisphaera sp.]
MPKVNLNQDFKELLLLLNSEEVRYLLLGGYAVNFHGYKRFTGDLDVWISTDVQNADRVSTALQKFGFSKASVLPEQFRELGQVIQFGRVPFRVDILTGPSGVEFEACYVRRISAMMDGVPVPIISYDDLQVNKQASGRLKDLADVEAFRKIKSRKAKKKKPGKRSR